MRSALITFFCFAIISSQAQWVLGDKTPFPLANNDKLEFDAEFSSDDNGNTYYCWTDFRNGIGELYAQKLNKFGEAQWATNGVKIGTVVDAVNYTLTIKAMYAMSDQRVLIAWHKVVNPNSPSEKEIFYNIVSENGEVTLGAGLKLDPGKRIFNSDVTMGTLAISEIEQNKMRIAFNTGKGEGSNGILTADIGSNGEVIGQISQIDDSFFEGSKVAFDELNKRMIVLLNKGFGNFELSSYDADKNKIVSNADFLKNPFSGDSRFDDFTIVNGQIIIGRTLTGDAGRRVIAHRLDENLNSIWREGGVVLGSGTGFDIHASLNEDGGGTVAWIEPNSSNRMVAARFDSGGTLLWEKPVYIGQEGKSYFTPNKYASDGKNGLYNLWFTTKSGGFNLSLQHLDGDGNQVWGEEGLQIEGFNWYGVFRVFPHVEGGVITLYSGTTNSDINANDTYNLFANYISPEGEFGLKQKLTASLNKETYCAGESLVANLDEGNYTAEISDDTGHNQLTQGELYNVFTLPEGLANKAYNIVFTDENGLNSEPIEINIISLLEPNLSGDILEKCSETDDALTLNGSCEIGSLLWSTGDTETEILVSPESSTTYTAFCKLEGCKKSGSSEISVEVTEIKAVASNSGSYLEGETIQLTSSGGDIYSWSGPNGFTSGEQNPSITNSSLANAGNYSVTVSSSLGCSQTANTLVEVKKILSAEPTRLGVKIYPNPAVEVLRFLGNSSFQGVDVISNDGKVTKLYFDKNQRIIKVSELYPGTYILKIKNDDGSYSFSRFVKQ